MSLFVFHVVFVFLSSDCCSIGKGLWIVNNKSPDIILIEFSSYFLHMCLFVTLGKNGECNLFDIPCNFSSDSRPLHEIIVKQSFRRQQTDDFIWSFVIRWNVKVVLNFQQFLHYYWYLWDKSWRVSHSLDLNKQGYEEKEKGNEKRSPGKTPKIQLKGSHVHGHVLFISREQLKDFL